MYHIFRLKTQTVFERFQAEYMIQPSFCYLSM